MIGVTKATQTHGSGNYAAMTGSCAIVGEHEFNRTWEESAIPTNWSVPACLGVGFGIDLVFIYVYGIPQALLVFTEAMEMSVQPVVGFLINLIPRA
jgi:hypothetical protein